MDNIPRILSVAAITSTQLYVVFHDGSKRVYDCQPLLDRERFHHLKNCGFFRTVHVDAGGYGISWNDNIDLSEYELWTNGKPAAETSSF